MQDYIFNRHCSTAKIYLLCIRQNFCISIDKKASSSGGRSENFVSQTAYPNRNRPWSPVALKPQQPLIRPWRY